jgi:hypothetical protein
MALKKIAQTVEPILYRKKRRFRVSGIKLRPFYGSEGNSLVALDSTHARNFRRFASIFRRNKINAMMLYHRYSQPATLRSRCAEFSGLFGITDGGKRAPLFRMAGADRSRPKAAR